MFNKRINKKIIILVFLIILLALLISLIISSKSLKKSNNIKIPTDLPKYEPVFMTSKEKEEWGIDQDIKIQVIRRRDEDNGIMVYKVIRQESDLYYPED